MQAALRPYVTAGVALVGASVIAVSPVAVPPPDIEIRDTAVELSAQVNPIEVFGPIFETALENAQIVAQAIAANPAPILEQILANQLGNIGSIGEGLAAQIGVIPQLPGLLGDTVASQLANIGHLAGLGQTFLENALGVITGSGTGTLQDQIQGAIDLIDQGQIGLAFGNLAVLPLLPLLGNGLENILLLPQLIEALQQPLADAAALFPIAAGPLGNVANAIGVFGDISAVLPIGLGALLAVNGAAVAVGNAVGGLIDAVQNGDPEAAFNTIVNQSAAVTTALLNGALNPNFGLVAGLQGLREAIAEAITPTAPESVAAVASVPRGAAQSFTLTAPPEKAPALNAGAPSGGETAGSGAVDVGTVDPSVGTKDASGDVTPTDTPGNLKGGNLFVPGGTAAQGGRHRADNGSSFGQGLRDAAVKTIKGLTSLGRGGDSGGTSAGASNSGGGSGSGSSDSGASGSGSGSGSGNG
jgi:hypothetical protein